MRPNLHPSLVNGRFGDPALFVEVLHRRDALLFDMGDLSALSARDLLRIGHVFVSHMHIDHFIGFDALLRVNVGREKLIRIAGPEGLCDRLHHKLQGYAWDLAHRYPTDLVFVGTDLAEGGPLRSARFHFKEGFGWRDEPCASWPLDAGEGLQVSAVVLEHHGPCIGYALSEPAHANVWANRLGEVGLAPGGWLKALKQAVLGNASDDCAISMPDGRSLPLGTLRHLVSITAGQKIAYVTDVADTPANRRAIVALGRGADTLFIEARFAGRDAEQAHDRAHLTTRAAGQIARAAQVRSVEPFHFSPRYEGEEERMVGEVGTAFAGREEGSTTPLVEG
jgi:ribonuclease Z